MAVLTIVKNTIPAGIKAYIKNSEKKSELAIKRGLEVMRSYTLPFVPVKTGRLKGSLTSRVSKEGIYNVGQKGNSLTGRRFIGEFGTNVPYASYVEFGTSRFKGRYYMTKGISASREALKAVIFNTLKGK